MDLTLNAGLVMVVTGGLSLLAEWWPWLHRQFHKLSEANRKRLVVIVALVVSLLLTGLDCSGMAVAGFSCPEEVTFWQYAINALLALIVSQTAHPLAKRKVPATLGTSG